MSPAGPHDLPPLRGTLRRSVPLAPLTWLRVGGPAQAMAQPADAAALSAFLADLDPRHAVVPMGAASNILVRDGGLSAVVVRLGGPLAAVEVVGDLVVAGGGALDVKVAQVAARAGLAGLEFMVGVPGSVGGAVRMNAGAFGGETAERLAWIDVLDRQGLPHRLGAAELAMTYRRSALPGGCIVLRAAFALVPGDPTAIQAAMAAVVAERERSQPLRAATGGSTFKNPPGQKAWQLIDRAGCRGLRFGRAMVSDKHCNFLINTGGATAGELESLGQEVVSRVQVTSGVRLEWEIVRLGQPVAVDLAA